VIERHAVRLEVLAEEPREPVIVVDEERPHRPTTVRNARRRDARPVRKEV